MTEDILDMMHDRRYIEKNDLATYKTIDTEIQILLEMILRQKHDSFNLHKMVKEAAGIQNCKQVGRRAVT